MTNPLRRGWTRGPGGRGLGSRACRRLCTLVVCGGLLALAWCTGATGGAFVIDSARDWEQWTFNGRPLSELAGQQVFTLAPEGVIRAGSTHKGERNVAPRSVSYSYSRGGTQFTGGVRAAGSNPQQAVRVLDGRSDTYWVPSASDGVEAWWLEIDLGYAVSAKKVRLVFAEGRTPMPSFQVYLSEGARRFRTTASLALDYELVAATRRPNEQRAFEIVFDSRERYLASGGQLLNDPESPEVAFVPPTDTRGDLVLGRVVQFVKIVFEEKVPDPGLAEVEVYAIGENVAEGVMARGGSYEAAYQMPAVGQLFDGLMWTEWWVSQNAEWEQQGWFKLDLGNAFWLDTIRLLSLPRSKAEKPGTDIDGFKLYVSDGTTAPFATGSVWQVDGRDVYWEQVAEVHNDVSPRLDSFDLTFAPHRVRHLLFHHDFGAGFFRALITPGVFYELHLFGEGVIPGLTFRSGLLDLGQRSSLVSLSWGPEAPPGTRTEFRSRSGSRVETVKHYFTSSGKEVTKAAYDKLLTFLRGEIREEVVAVDSTWSGWSDTYVQSGEPFKSPSPRQYVQLEAHMVSERTDVAPSLDAVRIATTAPALSRVLGRIEPRRAEPGQPTRFTVIVAPTFAAGDVGYDQLRLHMPGRPDSVTVSVGGVERADAQVTVGRDSLRVDLPVTVRRDTVRIGFVLPLYSNGAVFTAFLGRSSVPDLVQRVDPDPASKGAMTVLVSALATDRLVGGLQVQPACITPNGDGINDEMTISFTVLKVETPREVRVSIHDLTGRMVARLHSAPVGSGPLTVAWDGRNAAQQRVAPGLYLCRVEVDAQAGLGEALRPVAVAY